jgi:hypothetical protein
MFGSKTIEREGVVVAGECDGFINTIYFSFDGWINVGKYDGYKVPVSVGSTIMAGERYIVKEKINIFGVRCGIQIKHLK